MANGFFLLARWPCESEDERFGFRTTTSPVAGTASGRAAGEGRSETTHSIVRPVLLAEVAFASR